MEKGLGMWNRQRFLLILLFIPWNCAVVARETNEQRKRQIYREGVLPARGGVIPEAAFTRQRLKHNVHDSLGIEAPDGYVYLTRDTDVRPGRRDPEDERDILTLTNHGPQAYTAIHGVIPPKPQPTTYLLRRPASGSLRPSHFTNFHDALPHRLSYTPHGWQIYPQTPQVIFAPTAGLLH